MNEDEKRIIELEKCVYPGVLEWLRAHPSDTPKMSDEEGKEMICEFLNALGEMAETDIGKSLNIGKEGFKKEIDIIKNLDFSTNDEEILEMDAEAMSRNLIAWYVEKLYHEKHEPNEPFIDELEHWVCMYAPTTDGLEDCLKPIVEGNLPLPYGL